MSSPALDLCHLDVKRPHVGSANKRKVQHCGIGTSSANIKVHLGKGEKMTKKFALQAEKFFFLTVLSTILATYHRNIFGTGIDS